MDPCDLISNEDDDDDDDLAPSFVVTLFEFIEKL